MMKLWVLLKTVRFGVWFLCFFIIYVGVCFIHSLNTPISESEIADREAQRYENFYNKVRPNENLPKYDYNAWGLLKRDGRYFLIPKEYAGASGFSFFWPLSLQKEYSTAIYDNQIDIQRRNKAIVVVYMDSKIMGYTNPNAPRFDLAKEESCYAPIGASKRWNGLVIGARLDDSHLKDWPQICLEIVRILRLVKEVKKP